jgi:hypothetical protein
VLLLTRVVVSWNVTMDSLSLYTVESLHSLKGTGLRSRLPYISRKKCPSLIYSTSYSLVKSLGSDLKKLSSSASPLFALLCPIIPF